MDSTRGTSALAALVLACAIAFVAPGCTSSTEPVNVVWEATLAPTIGHVVTGTAGAVTQSGRVAATIQIRNGTADETYGWRIDAGDCGGSGAIQGGAALYPPLTPDGSGTATAEAGIPGTLDPASPYVARVFLSGAGVEEVVACGDLRHQ